MKNKNFFLPLLLLFFCYFEASAQDTVAIKNPSFEGSPLVGTMTSKPPKFWYNCGHPGETAPDIHGRNSSGLSNHFQVNMVAAEGRTFLGLVTRDNETWEAVAQELPQALLEEEEYMLTIALARSPKYISPGRKAPYEAINYTKPVTFRVWGGNGYCQKEEILASTGAIEHEEWVDYDLILKPTAPYTYILLEAFYVIPVLYPTSGHILLDNLRIETISQEKKE